MLPNPADPASPVILALATSTERCAVALGVPAEHPDRSTLFSLEADVGSRSSGSILQLVEQLLRQAGRNRESIDVIAFDQGPGAFTGVRLGCSVAQGLGYALNRPLLALSSLEVIAAAALSASVPDDCGSMTELQTTHLIWSAQDARMQELYCAAHVYDPTRGLSTFQAPTVLGVQVACELMDSASVRWLAERSQAIDRSPAAKQSRPIDQSLPINQSAQAEQFEPVSSQPGFPALIAAGNGFERFPELRLCADRLGMQTIGRTWPSAVALARLGLIHWRSGRAIAAHEAEPLYVRNKVALNVDEQRRKS